MEHPNLSCQSKGKQSSELKVAGYNVLSNDPLPWGADGQIYWHFRNFTQDMTKHEQVLIFAEVFNFYNRKLMPLVSLPTKNNDEAYFKIHFVDEKDQVVIKDEEGFITEIFESPHKFIPEPQTLAVCYGAMHLGGKYINKNYHKLSGHIYVNDAYFWHLMDKGAKKDLKLVLKHELFHGFGGNHSDDERSFNAPYYNPEGIWLQDDSDMLNSVHGFDRMKYLSIVEPGKWLYRNVEFKTEQKLEQKKT